MKSTQRHPGGVGYIEDYIRDEPEVAEEHWQQVENRLPAAFDALDDGTALDDPAVVETLRDCLALHWARSRTLKAMHDSYLPQIEAKARLDMAGDPNIAAIFYDRYKFWPAGPQALDVLAADFARELVAEFEKGEFLRERAFFNFDKAKTLAANAGLQIARPGEGEFVISDDPAQSLRGGHGGVGPLGGVPWGEADTIVLPLGPLHVLSLGAQHEWVELDEDGVRNINGAQIASAHERVIYRLRDGLHDKILRIRQETDAARGAHKE